MKAVFPLRLVTFFLLTVITSIVHAQYVSASEHLMAIKTALRTVSFGELVIHGMKQGMEEKGTRDTEHAANKEKLLDGISPEAIINRVAPIYMQYLTYEEAVEVTRFFHTPTGHKLLTAYKSEAQTGRKAAIEEMGMTMPERRHLNSFLGSNVWRRFDEAHNKAAEEMKAALIRLWKETGYRSAVSPFTRRLAKLIENRADGADISTETENPTPASTSDPNMVYLDRVVRMIEASRSRTDALRAKYDAEIKKLELETILSPPNLVSKDRIDVGHKKIMQLETLLDTQVGEIARETEDLYRRLKALEGPESFRQSVGEGLDKSFRQILSWYVRFGENQRMLIDVFRRLLAFSESRLGKISLEGNQLLFDTAADLEMYRALRSQLAAETEREDQLVKESEAWEKEALRKLSAY